MITKFINKLNKRKYHYRTYQIESNLQHILPNALSSPLLGEGSINYQLLLQDKTIRQFLTIPTQIQYLNGKKVDNHKIKFNGDLFTVQLDSNNFFPLLLNNESGLIKLVNQISQYTNTDESLLIELRMKRKKDIDELFLDQYEQFVHGVENPSSNKLVKYFQSKMVNEDDIVLIDEDIANVIQHKINDYHYEFQLFIGIDYDKNKRGIIQGLIQNTLDEFAFMNTLTLEASSYELKEDIDFSYSHTKQYISLSEICSLINLETTVQNTISTTTNVKHTPPTVAEKTNANSNDTFNSLLEVLPTQPIQQNIDNSIDELIIRSLKRTNIIGNHKMETVSIEQGSTLNKVTFTIPASKNISDFNSKKAVENVQAIMGVESLTVEQGNKPETIAFSFPREDRQVVYLRDLIQETSFQEFAKEHPLPFIVGLDEIGKPIYECMSRIKHLLGAGQTGGGKSYWMNQMLLTLLMMRSNSELELYLIDPKMVELSHFEGFPQVKEVIFDMQKTMETLEKVVDLMEERYKFLHKEGLKTIEGYNKANKDKIPFIVVIIDEYADLKMQCPEVDTIIQRINQKGRAGGIHAVVFTQRPDAKVIDGTVKANLPSTVCFRLKKQVDYQTVFGTGIPYKLLGHGDGVCEFEGKPMKRFQGAVVSLDETEEKNIYEEMKKRVGGNTSVTSVVETKVDDEEPIDKLKRIIATTGETRVKPLAKEMKIGVAKATDMMRELVTEGWLKRDEETNKGYLIAVDDEELDKWR